MSSIPIGFKSSERFYQNHLGLTAKHTKCILIADGPSKQIIIDNPRLADMHYVAVVNRAGYQWPWQIDYWFSCHPEYFEEWTSMCNKVHDKCILIGFQNPHLIVPNYKYINTNYRFHSCGTSSLFAVENLIAIGYKEIDMYGVDLNEAEYNGHRKLWRALYKDAKEIGVTVINRGGIWK